MTRTIENSFLKISVSDHGAELTGIYDKTNDREILWQADPAYWKRHAPVLFPNVGRHFEDHYRINGDAMRLYFFPTWDVTTKISGV